MKALPGSAALTGEPAVGRLHGGDPGDPQLLRQAALQRSEQPLHPPARLWRVGGDLGDAELLKGTADLGRVGLVDLAAGLRRVSVPDEFSLIVPIENSLIGVC